ncbi:hypothetical protein PG993_014515 [Apiospora rasikravindrae]|uniref:Uncharacterized protein n=1 Tax=Apiospora rasikravindrae TaxID=990691 RepID=A0ABR1RP29_9PEZI
MEDTIVDFDALYREERKGFLKDFKGKKPRIEEQFHQFWEHPNAEKDATAYLQNDEAYAYPKIPKWVQGKTIFTNFQDKEKILAEDEEVLISSNHASFDIAQYPGNSSPAGMSMIHLLGLPKKSIYNGVALDKDNVQIIDKIMNLFKSSWSDRRFREQVLKHQGDAIDRQFQAAMGKANEKPEAEATKGHKLADEGHELAKKHHEELGGKIHNLDVDGFQFGLHLYPDHSISHFHMHIVAMHPGMRGYSTSQHDEKTKDAEEVRGAVMAFDRKTRTFDKSWVANTT